MKQDWLAGYIPDLPTPFDEDGEIDFDAFARLCERQIASGASAIVVGETTGEAPTLTTVEKAGLVRRAVELAHGRIRVIAGAGSNATDRAVELTRQAEAAGADAVLSVVPYYNKPMQAGIYPHFRAVAEATGLPVILHDVPSRSLRELADATLKRLAESEQFIGLRDSSGDVGRLVRIRTSLPPHFRLLSGDDLTALPFMTAGGHGCISAVTNLVPELCQAALASLSEGRPQSARYLFSRLVPIAGLLAAEHPAALKYALSLLGLMQPNTRLPIVQLNDAAKAEVKEAIAELGDEEWSSVEIDLSRTLSPSPGAFI
ncbi:4-hydroxy-tetrahydrodipicolinate synthase [Bradyrhizobium neotropicale]|uniref:4-hydroxy-tetrahydrodipicolinate synthase n=1 Tax=Bradyrhizobium neotropicale TaxID=1497615 RepID=UPI001AD779A0|nr:4-hydroxy-tetrahydrodipicolinate synthase [Bradyrhizobium neotropicale]MBO4224364.1 4-hydroxy-tetrahydrodipicolinate synthase [Bradyrhizobium neotropicale]